MESIFSNYNMFILMEAILGILIVVATVIPIKNHVRVFLEKRKGVTATGEVTRGMQTMNELHVFYGVTTYLYITFLQTVQEFDKIQIALIILNYGALTFLFYFSSWFRNKLIVPFIIRIKKD